MSKLGSDPDAVSTVNLAFILLNLTCGRDAFLSNQLKFPNSS